ncbi:MAG: hypothetical protein ACKPKO_18790 [Candidatus Fonsibacter sp.]
MEEGTALSTANRLASAALRVNAAAKAPPKPRRITNRQPASTRNIQPSSEPTDEIGGASKAKKKGGSVNNTIEDIIESSKLPPAEQALPPTHKLNTKVARPKNVERKKNGGLAPILEHSDIQNDPYYMKPSLPTHIK